MLARILFIGWSLWSRGGLVNSHDSKGVLAYFFGIVSHAKSGIDLPNALKDTGPFGGWLALDFDGRNNLAQINIFNWGLGNGQ